MMRETQRFIETNRGGPRLKIERTEPKRPCVRLGVVHHVPANSGAAPRFVNDEIVNLKEGSARKSAAGTHAHQPHRVAALERRVQLVTVEFLKSRALKKCARVEVRAKVARKLCELRPF